MAKKYESWTKAQLIEHLRTLEDTLNNTLKQENESFLVSFPWAGNLGQWHWFFDKNHVIFNEKKATQLGYDPKEIGEVGFQFFTEKLHTDDYERVMDNMRQHLNGNTPAYEVEYRIQHRDGHYLWYYDRGTVTKRDAEGQPAVIQGIVFDITEQKRTEDKLRFYSKQDALTSLYNRRKLFETLETQIATAQKEDTPFSLIMFDIDDFKAVNDDHGHDTGDAVLKHLADIIIADKRTKDMGFRYGGDEFFLLLPNTNLASANKVAKRFNKLVQDTTFPDIKTITLSMGVVSYHPSESVDHLLKRADQLMYEAKSSGKNNIKAQSS